MPPRFIITGTDTNIGKTVFAAALAQYLAAYYWKPIQAGLEGETDTQVVRRLSGIPETHLLPSAYTLALPASPHLAAESEGIQIDITHLQNPPQVSGPLVIEGAGGLMVPLIRTPRFLQIDLFSLWKIPVILCARTSLGTLNHTFLSLEALRARHIPIAGIALLGDAHEDNEYTLKDMSPVPMLGRLPVLTSLTSASLQAAFCDHIAPQFDRIL